MFQGFYPLAFTENALFISFGVIADDHCLPCSLTSSQWTKSQQWLLFNTRVVCIQQYLLEHDWFITDNSKLVT